MALLPFARSRTASFFSSLFTPRLDLQARKALWTISTVSASIGMTLCMTPVASASNFSQMVFFGDSLMDSGFYTGVGQQPSFTTNPDLIWTQLLARKNGLTADPAYVLTPNGVVPLNGTNYAIGGALTSQQSLDPASGFLTPSVTDQVNNYLSSRPKADKNALYSVWAGSNDVFAYTTLNQAGLGDPDPAVQAATAQTIVGLVAGEAVNVAGLVGTLQRAGAGKVLVLNLPDIGNTPLAAQLGLQQLWTASAYTFNQTLNQSLNQLGGNIIALDVFSLLDEVIRNPALYGFKNVTLAACTTPDSGTCTAATLVEPNANMTYLFADSLHPGGAAQAILAQYAQSVLLAPTQISLLASAPLVATQAQTLAIDNRLRLFGSAPVNVGKPEAYAVVGNTQRNYGKTDNMQGLDGSATSATVGIDYAINQQWMIGTAFGYGQNKSNFGSNTGSFKLDQAMISGYTQYRDGAWAVSAIGLAGLLQYNNVTRSLMLGQALRKEKGTTAGDQLLLRLGGQYDFAFGAAVLSPIANLTWQQIKVEAYDERGNDSTAMHFDAQTRISLVSSVGLQLTANQTMWGFPIQPFAKLAWDRELKNTPNEVRAHVIGMGGSFGMPGYQGAANTTHLDLGANIKLASDTTAFVNYSGQFASGNRANTFQLGVAKLF
ncbi:autotransporter domain-containing protein [Glaciimonas immobilis]|uniref:Outer membrane lipase/esterase n=1 Tax=Glaciimonas immobilis TaxID=728004 RepID=A0A840RV06_9BURK|nr:autotransporter domain-containing protein [Glaciimonas immobilis]KAF3999922.1 autotransporter domain-containing protein [Glaciimonas immobilis]MBB5200421.1 outer membrane lipase/esterase [Glaciimonas immobilis]